MCQVPARQSVAAIALGSLRALRPRSYRAADSECKHYRGLRASAVSRPECAAGDRFRHPRAKGSCQLSRKILPLIETATHVRYVVPCRGSPLPACGRVRGWSWPRHERGALRPLPDGAPPTGGSRPNQAFRAASSALSTRGGDIGTWVMRTPNAFDMALAMAAMGGTIEVSPTPRTP